MKKILVTGATGGLGQVICQHLSKSGYGVVPTGRNTEKLKKLLEILEKDDDSFYSSLPSADDLVLDLAELDRIEKFFEMLGKSGIQLDGMVFASGMQRSSLIRVTNIESVQQVFAVNCFSFMEFVRCFGKKKHSNDSASVVAISSMAAIKNPTGMAVYSASKAALNSMIETMAKEYEKRKIRFNAILPGYLEKSMNNEFFPWSVEQDEERIGAIQSYGRIPYKKVADTVDFLLSNDSSYITGDLMKISGGQH